MIDMDVEFEENALGYVEDTFDIKKFKKADLLEKLQMLMQNEELSKLYSGLYSDLQRFINAMGAEINTTENIKKVELREINYAWGEFAPEAFEEFLERELEKLEDAEDEEDAVRILKRTLTSDSAFEDIVSAQEDGGPSIFRATKTIHLDFSTKKAKRTRTVDCCDLG